jgi:hypothetical protein
MFVGSGGKQYLMPTTGGQVIPADEVGGGGVTLKVEVINQHSGATVNATMGADGRTARIVITEISSQIRENSGEVWSALTSSSNVRGRF